MEVAGAVEAVGSLLSDTFMEAAGVVLSDTFMEVVGDGVLDGAPIGVWGCGI
jgi:hypothetical protein